MEVNAETASEILPMLGGRAGAKAGAGSDDEYGDPMHDGEDARLIVTAGGGGSGFRGSSFDDGLVSLPAGPLASALLDDGGWGDGDGQEMGRTPAWNITLNSIMYMAVPLSMPATLAAAGWLWGSLWFVYCTAATFWTGLIIGRVFNADPTLTTYPAMAAEAFAQLYVTRSTRNGASADPAGSGSGGGGSRDDVERLADGWRVFGRRLVVVMQFVTFYLDTVTQMIYVAQYFGQLFPGSKICQWAWLLIVWGISVPVMQIPTFHASRWVIVPATATLSLSVLFFLGEVAVVAPWNCQPGPSYGGVTRRSTFVSLASFAYAVGQLALTLALTRALTLALAPRPTPHRAACVHFIFRRPSPPVDSFVTKVHAETRLLVLFFFLFFLPLFIHRRYFTGVPSGGWGGGITFFFFSLVCYFLYTLNT